MSTFKAFRVHNENGKINSRFEQLSIDQIGTGNVVIKAAYSNINYKDALAATGEGRIMKRFPLVAGVDTAGYVYTSKDSRFKEGDPVLVVGRGLGEEHDGGFAEFVKVEGDWIVPLPAGLTLRDAMAVGTAGFTAALAIQRMEDNYQTPEKGTILVTGATGGVGGMATSMLSGVGYDVAALTIDGQEPYLKSLGAKEIVDANTLQMGERPLEKGLWAGAIDAVGGKTLAWITRTVKPYGNIASIGLAGGHDLVTTVMPFILRGVNLLGINSTYCAVGLRDKVWSRLASDLKPAAMDTIVTRTVAFDDIPDLFNEYIDGKITGRTVVEIQAE
ncbi:Acryloyl-CoA reductase AcuI/YhdH (EC [Olavius algarvensis Delta 1 endosymbiont]|nr:Acryloyl-CoA reductase AcuI/YhdH (EC [Olavius algarvensis Delta 1 endosymbiont]